MDLGRLPPFTQTALKAEYLKDPSSAMKWSDLNKRGSEFHPLAGEVESFGVVSGAMWFRSVLNRGTQTKPMVLVAWGTLLNHVDVYFLDQQGRLVENYHAGDSVDPDSRLPRSLAFQFPVPDLPSTTVLIRIETFGSLVFQMYLWEQDSLERNLEFQNLLLGLVFGFLFLMVVINLLFRFSLKDSRFLWYAFYVASLSFFLMVYTGWLRFLVLPVRFPQDFWDVGCLGLLIASATWFCRKANRLQSIRGNRTYSWLLTGLAVLGSLVGLTGGKNLGLTVLNVTLLLMILGCWGFVFAQVRRGSVFSRFFLAAWTTPLVSGLLITVQAIFVSRWDGFNPYYLLVSGILIETLILSFAFSYEVHHWHRSVLLKLSESYKQDRLIALGIMSSRVGHEINTPNHVIALNIASLEAQGKQLLTGDLEFYNKRVSQWATAVSPTLQSMKEASRQIDFVVGQLLADRNSGSKIVQPCDLAEIADLAWKLHRPRWEGRSIKWNWPVPPSDIVVLGHPFRLQQLLVNLVENAVHSLEGKEGLIRVQIGKKESIALLHISDDGKGMDKDEISQLGTNFFSTKKERGGHGLGWGICQEIAKEHRGELVLESSLGMGTKVTFSMPLFAAHPEQ